MQSKKLREQAQFHTNVSRSFSVLTKHIVAMLDRVEHQLLRRLWPDYFETEECYRDGDPRLLAVERFRDMLCERGCCAKLLVGKDIEAAASITFDLPTFATHCPNPHFFEGLTTQPDITLGCLGLGLCLVRHQARPDLLLIGQKLIPRFVNSAHATDIGQLKSLLVNKFVTVVGNVVRASSITVIVTGAEFSCPKCGAVMHRRFEEGKYNPPTRCLGSNCKVSLKLLLLSRCHHL
jgi:DNA replicative helicase MCM subunit Mcm2 (Cdc46/Mcm family)